MIIGRVHKYFIRSEYEIYIVEFSRNGYRSVIIRVWYDIVVAPPST